LERIAQDPPINGNALAQTRVLMAARSVREFGLGGGAPAQEQPRCALDDLVAEWESDPEKAKALAEGRQWVSNTFYGAEQPRDVQQGKLPPLPGHPEPHTYTWTDLEKRAIAAYGEACARAALATLKGQP
jgi:hypothetical protein